MLIDVPLAAPIKDSLKAKTIFNCLERHGLMLQQIGTN